MKKFLVLLAIFCVLGSAAAVSAAEVDDYDGGWAGSQYDDTYDGGWAGSQYNDTFDGGWAGSQYNESEEGLTDRPLIDPDYAHMEPGSNSTDNATEMAAGEPAANETANITANAATSHSMLSTGNPILALLAVGAVLGGYSVLRRK